MEQPKQIVIMWLKRDFSSTKEGSHGHALHQLQGTHQHKLCTEGQDHLLRLLHIGPQEVPKRYEGAQAIHTWNTLWVLHMDKKTKQGYGSHMLLGLLWHHPGAPLPYSSDLTSTDMCPFPEVNKGLMVIMYTCSLTYIRINSGSYYIALFDQLCDLEGWFD